MKERILGEIEYKSDRENAFLDYARVVASIAVIIMHIMINISNDFSTPGRIFGNYIGYNKFADYLFFMLSGYSFMKYKTSITINKSLRLTLKRYVGLSLFAISYNYIEHLWINNLSYKTGMIQEALCGGLLGRTWDHLWFMYNLLVIYLLMPFLLAIYKNKNKYLLIAFTLILSIACFFGITISINSPIHILSMMPFSVVVLSVTIGAFFYRYNFFEKISKWIWLFIMVFMTVLWFCGRGIFRFFNSEFFIILFAFVVLIFFYKTFNKKSKAFSILASHNYIIYLVHVVFLHLITKVWKINPYEYMGMVGIVMCAMVIYLLSLGSAIIIEKIPYIGDLYRKK